MARELRHVTVIWGVVRTDDGRRLLLTEMPAWNHLEAGYRAFGFRWLDHVHKWAKTEAYHRFGDYTRESRS